jgi:hypothetical protein
MAFSRVSKAQCASLCHSCICTNVQDDSFSSLRHSFAEHIGVSVEQVVLELDRAPVEDNLMVKAADLFNKKDTFKVNLVSPSATFRSPSSQSVSEPASMDSNPAFTITANMPTGEQAHFQFQLGTDKAALGQRAKEFCQWHGVTDTSCPSTIFTAASERQEEEKLNAGKEEAREENRPMARANASAKKLVRRKMDREPQLEALIQQVAELRAEVVDVKLQNTILQSEVSKLKSTTQECCEILYE